MEAAVVRRTWIPRRLMALEENRTTESVQKNRVECMRMCMNDCMEVPWFGGCSHPESLPRFREAKRGNKPAHSGEDEKGRGTGQK